MNKNQTILYLNPWHNTQVHESFPLIHKNQEIVYGISYWDLKRGSQIKPIFITNTPGEGLSLFSPIMDVVPYVGETRDFIIEDLNGDGCSNWHCYRH